MTLEKDYLDSLIDNVKETISSLEHHHGQLHAEWQRAFDNHKTDEADRVKIARRHKAALFLSAYLDTAKSRLMSKSRHFSHRCTRAASPTPTPWS